MRNVLPLIVFFMFLSFGMAQNDNRVEISGNVIVDNNDVEGITISNLTSERIAITDMNGKFSLFVALNDKIEISALQFDTVLITIKQGAIDSKQLTIFLDERLTALDEVVILPFRLTGDLSSDLNKIRLFNPKLEKVYFGEVDMEDNPYEEIYYQKVENTILNQGTFYNGVDFVKITNWLIKPLMGSNNVSYAKSDSKGSNYNELRDTYTKDFISSSFNIPVDKVEDFIAFAEVNNTDSSLYENGKELELIEYLVNQSKLFLETNPSKN